MLLRGCPEPLFPIALPRADREEKGEKTGREGRQKA